MKKVLVRWMQNNSRYIINGIGKPRNKGDEDEMEPREARAYEACGMVEILAQNAANAIPKITAQSVVKEEKSAPHVEDRKSVKSKRIRRKRKVK